MNNQLMTLGLPSEKEGQAAFHAGSHHRIRLVKHGP